MNSEEKKLLEETHALARDNHHLLRAVRRHQLIGAYWKIVVWAIALIAAFSFYQVYVRPQLATFEVNGITTHGPFGFPTSADMQKLIDSYRTK